MTKVLKIAAITIGCTIEWLLIILIAFVFLIRNYSFQTFVAKKASSYLSKELNTKIEIGRLEIIFPNKISLKDILILDLKKDSILQVKEISLIIGKVNLPKNRFIIAKTELNSGSIGISRDKQNGNYNYEFIADYFSTDSKSKTKPATLIFNEISMNDFNLKYDDFRKGQLEFGLDYDHIKIADLSLHLSNFKIDNDIISMNLNHLKLKEQSGFGINRLRSNVTIASNGIKLTEFYLKTPKTNLKCPKLYLLFNNWEDFDEFEDRVKFDVKISPSLVSLRDISFFAPEMEGMDADVHLKALVSQRVRDLNIQNLDLRFGKKTILQGNLILPDFRQEGQGKLNEDISYAYLDFKDIESFHLPKGNGKVSFDNLVSKFKYAQISNLRTNGEINNFNLIFNNLNTHIGSFSLKNYISVSHQNNTTNFKPFIRDSNLLSIREFNLAQFIEDSNFGLINGEISLNGKISDDGEVELVEIFADLDRFDFSNYPYSRISLKDGYLKNQIIGAKLQISDPNLDLAYEGDISYGSKQHYELELDIKKAFLTNLGLTSAKNASLSTNVSFHVEGSALNRLKGTISSKYISYIEDSNSLNIPGFNFDLERTSMGDIFELKSPVLNAKINGKINYETVVDDFLSEFSIVFPSLNKIKSTNKRKGISDFSFDFRIGNSDEFMDIFVPSLKINANSQLSGNYNSLESNLNAKLTSQLIEYDDFTFENLNCTQTISKSGINGNYQLDQIKYGDSLKFETVLFTVNGKSGVLNSELSWDPNTEYYSSIQWQTIVLDNNLLNFQLHPSFFSLNGLQWKIESESDISLSSEDVNVTNLKLARNNQKIQIEGCISNNNSDKIKLNMDNFDLYELSHILGLTTELGGKVSGWGEISNPYYDFNYQGKARIQDFQVNKEEVGNIQFWSDWNQKRETIIVNGDLEYKNFRTFDFSGFYDVGKDNLDLFLNFENTDIEFTNAFMDPSVVKDISGKINGKIKVDGNPSMPKLKGKLNLSKGGALVELLGVKYTINGNIIVEEDAFLIDPIPVSDEDGNTAALVGTVNHSNFEKWNFDLQFNFEDDLFKKQKLSGKIQPLEQFQVLKTKFKEGDIYYGTAYARGYANIEGTENSLSITVEAETKPNTHIFFPMYGISELEEKDDFVTIIDKSIKNKIEKDRIDLSGIDLDMKFKFNQNAKINLIFNDITNDEITATGKGEINLKLDQLDNVFLEGTYTIAEGSKYNFTMAGIQQPFEIEKGSTIKWSGSPYNADININTFVNLKKVSILELSPELMDNSLLNQEVNCYLKLDETLLKPHITFDIKAPRAPETGKALIRRVTSDNDELNRQFFSLLIARKFQPLKGTISASSSAAIDLVESQINAALNNLTDSYKLNVDYGEERTMGEKSFEVGFKKGLLNDRLIISSSIGVESRNSGSESASNNGASGSSSSGATKSSALIGDVNIEYIINEKGTFRANIFNKSNNNSINQQAGPFTQGAGISYLEEFNNWNDFELVQYGLDIFRKKEKKKFQKTKNKTKIPIELIKKNSNQYPDEK